MNMPHDPLGAGHRILLVAGYAPSLINFRGPLVRALLEAGLEVHAAAPELSTAEARHSLEAWGVTVHDAPMQRTGLNPLGDLRALAGLRRLMRQIQPDAVLGYTIKPVIYGTLAAWLAGVPRRFALITGLGYAFTGEVAGKRALIQRLVRALYASALRRTQRVFFQNPDDRALFHALGILDETTPTTVVDGSGIDLSHFAPVPLPSGPPRFLLIARLLGDKGIREYVAAARRVRRCHPEVVFRLVGELDEHPDGIGSGELAEWVTAGEIDYLGRRDDVRPAIAESSVYVLPSYREGTPRTVLEAMAMGRAIITTDAPGCRETVIDGDNGYLVPIQAVEALAEAMQHFIDHPQCIAEMGRRSREIAEARFDVHKVNAVMLEAMGIRTSTPSPLPVLATSGRA